MIDIQKRLIAFIKHHGYAFPILAGLSVMAYGTLYYLSPLTRLKLNGVHLRYQATPEIPTYLIGTHSTTKSWAYRDGEMDTPLASAELDEVGNVAVERDSAPQNYTILHVKSKEWIKMTKSGEDHADQIIPTTHPSLAPGIIVLDTQGDLLERQNNSSWRLGRAINFVFPSFPKGILHSGGTWTEQLHWTDEIGEWLIGWDGDFGWELKGFEGCQEQACAQLIYQGVLQPHVVRAPPWAAKEVTGITFDGSARGEATYSPQDKLITSNTFAYGGRISIQITSLENIPEEQHVGVPLTADPGVIVIEFANKIDIRKPN
jgi:hypothetical protein